MVQPLRDKLDLGLLIDTLHIQYLKTKASLSDTASSPTYDSQRMPYRLSCTDIFSMEKNLHFSVCQKMILFRSWKLVLDNYLRKTRIFQKKITEKEPHFRKQLNTILKKDSFGGGWVLRSLQKIKPSHLKNQW